MLAVCQRAEADSEALVGEEEAGGNVQSVNDAATGCAAAAYRKGCVFHEDEKSSLVRAGTCQGHAVHFSLLPCPRETRRAHGFCRGIHPSHCSSETQNFD